MPGFEWSEWKPHSLYQHVFFYRDPTLSFVGVAGDLFLFELQAKWIGSVLSERLSLPAQVELFAWNRKLNEKTKDMEKLFGFQWFF